MSKIITKIECVQLKSAGWGTDIKIEQDIDMSSHTITNLASPVNTTDCVSKIYSDTETILNATLLTNHITFMAGWKEYTSSVSSNMITLSPNISFITDTAAEVTELYVDSAGTYRVTFDSVYSVYNGKCECTFLLDSLLYDLDELDFDYHVPGYGSADTPETISPGYHGTTGATTHTGQLILSGDVNSVFVFKTGAAHSVAAGSSMTLQGGVLSSNVFWIAEGAISMGANCIMVGTFISRTAAYSIGADLTLDGRLLTRSGAIAVPGITGTVPLGYSVYTTGTLFESMLFYTNSGAISTSNYTNTNPEYIWKIETLLGVVSGFGEGIDGTFPNSIAPTITANLSIYSGDESIVDTKITIDSLIINNQQLSFVNNINVIDITKKLSIGVKITSYSGGILFGKRSLFAMPLVVL
jgi:hypothetical protein